MYEQLCELTKRGLEEGWVANIEVDGENYRRSKIALPCAETKYFSITTVYAFFSLLSAYLSMNLLTTVPLP